MNQSPCCILKKNLGWEFELNSCPIVWKIFFRSKFHGQKNLQKYLASFWNLQFQQAQTTANFRYYLSDLVTMDSSLNIVSNDIIIVSFQFQFLFIVFFSKPYPLRIFLFWKSPEMKIQYHNKDNTKNFEIFMEIIIALSSSKGYF